jgi:hypothetical protein
MHRLSSLFCPITATAQLHKRGLTGIFQFTIASNGFKALGHGAAVSPNLVGSLFVDRTAFGIITNSGFAYCWKDQKLTVCRSSAFERQEVFHRPC